MAIKFIPLKDFEPKSNMSFFFDTNIWIFLFCPIADFKRREQDAASNFLATLKRVNCEIVVTSLTLSEFANVYLRLDFKFWKAETDNYDATYKRDYVGSQRFKDTQILVEHSINQILDLCSRYNDELNSINMGEILTNFKSVDFNDAYFSILCERKKWIIFTHDKDFDKLNTNISVIDI